MTASVRDFIAQFLLSPRKQNVIWLMRYVFFVSRETCQRTDGIGECHFGKNGQERSNLPQSKRTGSRSMVDLEQPSEVLNAVGLQKYR